LGTTYSKSPEFYDAFCLQYSTFATPTNEAHSIRRGALNPLFSRKRVLALEEVVQDKVDKLIRRTHEAEQQGKPIDVHHGFRAISSDVISDYAFGKSYDILNSPDLGKNWYEMIQGLGPTMWFFQQFSFLRPLAPMTPKWMAQIISPPLNHMMKYSICFPTTSSLS
jgi:cytochrome P450